jgi:carboxymethylenebutenolidase
VALAHDGSMSEIQRYLAEEIALDYRDGHLSRREALRRLLLLGVGAATAPSLLAACADKEAPTAPSASAPSTDSAAASAPATSTSGSAAPPTAAPVVPVARSTEGIAFRGPEGRTLTGAWAAADKPRGAMLVIHENKGLTDHIRHIAGRLAEAGYSSLAIDLLSEEGGTASLGDPANATAALGKIEPDRFVADMRAALNDLAQRVPGVKLGAIGFCFGGAMTWRLTLSRHPKLAAAIPFYGPLPESADFTGVTTAVLAVYGELDTRVNATRDAAQAALEKAKVVHEIVTYPGADHAFLNDTGKRFHQQSATAAWTRVLEWLGKHLG